MIGIHRIVAIITTVFGLSGAPVAAQDVKLDAFFNLVAIGSADEVAAALERQPTLAIARNTNGLKAVHDLDYIEAGLDLNARDTDGKSVLVYADTFDDMQMINLLMAAGAKR